MNPAFVAPAVALALSIALTGAPRAEDAIALRIMTYNIWYGGAQVSLERTVAAIRAADADIVGLQEPDGMTAVIAARAGYPYVDLRRHIISRVPLFDSKLGERTGTGQSVYSLAGLDSDAAHAWALVAPGKVVAVANVHLTSDPYGPNAAQQAAGPDEVLAVEAEARIPEVEALAAALEPVVATGAPVFVTGDFNSPSGRDWTAAVAALRPAVKFPLDWPVPARMEAAGFTDSFRAVHPDPVARPGLTYSPGFPHPVPQEGEVMDRIDYVWSANATPTGSQVVGEAGNPDIDIAVTPWPSDHRAVVSTFAVVPADAPALIAVEPRLVEAGRSFLVRASSPGRADWGAVIVPRGGSVEQALTGVDGIAAYWQSAFAFSTHGLDPGPYDAVLLVGGAEAARTRFSVVPEGGRASIEVLTPAVRSGAPMTVRWAGAPGFRFDWIGVYARGDWNLYNYLAFAYTGAVLEGEMTLGPDLYYQVLEPGEYEVRLMADDHYEVLATAPFTVLPP
ncbi:MAG: endonuclease/exonuclease/phosphatase family protein [Rhodobacteraceae bacterium]|nr:endonuclease/exonuclease/phosphatase family protein [Paracoccaceae bacterium]